MHPNFNTVLYTFDYMYLGVTVVIVTEAIDRKIAKLTYFEAKIRKFCSLM